MNGDAIQTREFLDSQRCQKPGCDCRGVLYIHPTCHPRAGTWTSYHPEGFLEVECKECGLAIIRIEVAP